MNAYKLQIEELQVKELGEKIGYGKMMHVASKLWKQKLKETGVPEDRAFIPVIKTGEIIYTENETYKLI